MKKRSKGYFASQKWYRRIEREEIAAGMIQGRTIVEKRILRTPKRAAALLAHEAWCEEMSSICPNG